MAKVSLPLPERNADADALAEWGEELVARLGFLLSHLDSENMSLAFAEDLKKIKERISK